MFPGWPCGLRSDSCSSPSPPKNGNNCWSLHRQSAIVRLENIQASQFLLRSEFKDKPSCLLFTFAFMDAQGCMSIIRGKLKRKSGKGDDRTLCWVCVCVKIHQRLCLVQWNEYTLYALMVQKVAGYVFLLYFLIVFFVAFMATPPTPPKLKNSSRLMVPPVLQGLISLFPPMNSVGLCVAWQWLVGLALPNHLRGTSWNWHMSSPECAYKKKQKVSYRRFGLLSAFQAFIHEMTIKFDLSQTQNGVSTAEMDRFGCVKIVKPTQIICSFDLKQ